MLCAALAGETQEEKDNQLLNVSSFFLDVSSTRRESAVHNRDVEYACAALKE
jgi:hypothetical protein